MGNMFADLRAEYHRQICERVISVDAVGIPNNADKHSKISVALAKGILKQIDYPLNPIAVSGQTSGNLFEQITASFVEESFQKLAHLRPGEWTFSIGRRVQEFEQYEHLAVLEKALLTYKELRTAFGDYLIKPDIVIGRIPVQDKEINQNQKLIDDNLVTYSPLRKQNSSKPILHASISCKWTIRSDRSQNSRTEGLNLIRNRKGHTPHIMIVTAEPYPQRIASLALGTGDIDCVYHIALPELRKAAEEHNNEAVLEELDILIMGKRLRDIADLPFDLAI
jgi:NgoMIV restriction enzyme